MTRRPLRVMNAAVIDWFHLDLSASDHKPVLATYELVGGGS